MTSLDGQPFRVAHITAWLDGELRPQSAVGRRLHKPLCFKPGQEQQAVLEMQTMMAATALPPDVRLEMQAILGRIIDPGDLFVRLESGTCDAVDFDRLLRFADSCNELHAQCTPMTADGGFPCLAADDVAAFKRVQTLLQPCRTRDGFILRRDVRAHPDPLEARYFSAQAAYDTAYDEALHRLGCLGFTPPRKGEFLLTRGEYEALPLAVSLQLRVVQEGATQLLCEPRMTNAMLNAKKESEQATEALLAAETAELQRLTQLLRAESAALERAMLWIAQLDAMLQRLRFVQGYQACIPVLQLEPVLELQDVQFLPLVRELGVKYTPISFQLDPLAVIVGSNMGGKSAALATAALAILLAQRGLPLPARSARMSLFDDIVDLVAPRSSLAGLSDFGQEILQIQQLFLSTGRRNCILIDEFARTTNATEGRALLIGVLSALRQRGNIVFAATHFSGIAAALEIPQYRIRGLDRPIQLTGSEELTEVLEQLSCAFDRTLICEVAESKVPADALTVATALGLDAAVIAKARKVLEADGNG